MRAWSVGTCWPHSLMTSQACVISRIMQFSTGSPTLTVDTPEAPSCFALLSSESISGADSPPKSATSAILRRLWGTPQNCALSTRQAILHPSPMTHPAVLHLPFGGSGITAFGSTILAISSRTRRKSSPLWPLKAPTTFSHTMYRGLAVPEAASLCSLISLTSRVCSKKRTDRFPSNPAFVPAGLCRKWTGSQCDTSHARCVPDIELHARSNGGDGSKARQG